MKTTVIVTLAALICPFSAALAQVGNNSSVLNPNVAEAAELAGLPGLNDGLANKLVSLRPLDNGRLESMLPGGLARLEGRLFVPINLNTASREEIMRIPGMSGKMAHEFEEYRPYRSLEQFRREIGKYVDKDEVARLEQFVFVPLDLNSASSEDLGTIPGISAKMVHEFEEYRPYQSMEQFRREIGKYVSDDEVARLERYVEIR